MARERPWIGWGLLLATIIAGPVVLAANNQAPSLSLTDVEQQLANVGLHIVNVEQELKGQQEELAAFKSDLWGYNPAFEAVKPELETTAPHLLDRAKQVLAQFKALGDAKQTTEWERWLTDQRKTVDAWSVELEAWPAKYEKWTYEIDSWEGKLMGALKDFADLGPIKQQIQALWSKLEKARDRSDPSDTAAEILKSLRTLEPQMTTYEELIVPCQADVETWRAEAKPLGARPQAWRNDLKAWEARVTAAERDLTKRTPATR